MPKRVSVSTLKDLQKTAESTIDVIIDEIDKNEIMMTVKKYLSLQEFGSFVSKMSVAQFTEDEYTPHSANIIFAVSLVEYYTNINLPADIEAAYEIVTALDLQEKIFKIVSQNTQYFDLIEAIESAQIFAKMQKSGFSGVVAAIRKAIDRFDANDILNTLKRFTPEQLESFTELKDLAKIFAATSNPVSAFPKMTDSPADNEVGKQQNAEI